MLELLGTIAGNILSLPGVLGFAVGMTTRNLALAAILGGIVGLGEALVFGGFSIAAIGTLELTISVSIGILFGALGSLTRRKGTTV